MKLSKIFYNEKRWTKNALARDKNGDSINLDYIDRDNAQQTKLLESFSLHVALTWYFPYERSRDEREKARVKLRNAIVKYSGKDLNIREFNDLPTTTFRDIRNVILISENVKNIKLELDID